MSSLPNAVSIAELANRQTSADPTHARLRSAPTSTNCLTTSGHASASSSIKMRLMLSSKALVGMIAALAWWGVTSSEMSMKPLTRTGSGVAYRRINACMSVLHRHPPAPHAGQRTESVMSDALMPSGQPNRIVLYNAADGRVTVNVHFAQDNFWLPQRAIAELFRRWCCRNLQTSQEHLRVPRIDGGGSCFQMETLPLMARRTKPNFIIWTPSSRGLPRQLPEGNHFRIWATNTLREFRGEGLCSRRPDAQNGRAFGRDYFDELLEKIRRFAPVNGGPTKRSPTFSNNAAATIAATAKKTQLFYQAVQNRLHFANAGKDSGGDRL